MPWVAFSGGQRPKGDGAMFIFNRSFWAVGAGLATALLIVAASFVLSRPASVPAPETPAAATGAAANAPPSTS